MSLKIGEEVFEHIAIDKNKSMRFTKYVFPAIDNSHEHIKMAVIPTQISSLSNN